MALISYMVTAQLICAFVFAYAKSRFSHEAAQLSLISLTFINSLNVLIFYTDNTHSLFRLAFQTLFILYQYKQCSKKRTDTQILKVAMKSLSLYDLLYTKSIYIKVKSNTSYSYIWPNSLTNNDVVNN